MDIDDLLHSVVMCPMDVLVFTDAKFYDIENCSMLEQVIREEGELVYSCD